MNILITVKHLAVKLFV